MDTPMPLLTQATLAPATFSQPASFHEAYHAQTAARWARQLGGLDIDVEDVVQDVFLVVSRRLSSFRGEARFSSWLFEITRKIVANHRRRQRWRFWRSGQEESLASAPSQKLDPAAELERRQTVTLFYRALDRLPDKYRTVLARAPLPTRPCSCAWRLCWRLGVRPKFCACSTTLP
jgi:RNA polymerase sigma factor (sigma-70 family)